MISNPICNQSLMKLRENDLNPIQFDFEMKSLKFKANSPLSEFKSIYCQNEG